MNSSQAEQFLAKEFGSRVLPNLPCCLSAASVEVNSWLVTIHCFQTAPIDDDLYDLIELHSSRLLGALPPRQGDPWQLTVALHRVRPGIQPTTLGCQVESTTWAT